MTKEKATAPRSMRTQVANACKACRVSKVKCLGKHPTCARCSVKGGECLYDIADEGVTKREHLRNEATDQRRKLDSTLTVLDFLQRSSDEDATETLARLRLGETIDEVYHGIVNVKGWQPRVAGISAGDEQSAITTLQSHTVGSQTPYPIHETRFAAEISAIRLIDYWPQISTVQIAQQLGIGDEPSQPRQRPQQQHQPCNAWRPYASSSPSSTSPNPSSPQPVWGSIDGLHFEYPDVFDDGYSQ